MRFRCWGKGWARLSNGTRCSPVFSAENAICYKMSWERLPIEIASTEGNKTSNRV